MSDGDETEPDWDEIPQDPKETRIWGADLFAWAYDWLSESGAWRGQAEPEEIQEDDEVSRWRDQIRPAGGWVPSTVITSLREAVANEGAPVPMLKIVVAIDRAYTGIRLTRPLIVPMVASVAELALAWEDKGSLELAADGLVLRKGAHWRAGSSLAHYCDDLARVPDRLGPRVEICARTDAATLGSWLRDQGADAELTVAFVPTLDDMSGLAFKAVDRGRGRLFAVEPNPTIQGRLAAEAADLIGELEGAGANIAFLPETAIVPDVVQAIRVALIDNNAAAATAGGLPCLRLVVAGVCATRSNSAVALGADGRTLVTQQKTQRWRLDESQLDRYGLTSELGTEPRVEDISQDSDVVCFIDDPGLGRIAVLICEDLIRGDPAFLLASAVTPNIVLGPVCDGSLAQERWAYRAAQNLADEPGALTLVANSFVLADRQEHARTGAPVSSAGIGIIVHPSDWSQSEVVTGRPHASPPFALRRLTWSQAWA